MERRFTTAQKLENYVFYQDDNMLRLANLEGDVKGILGTAVESVNKFNLSNQRLFLQTVFQNLAFGGLPYFDNRRKAAFRVLQSIISAKSKNIPSEVFVNGYTKALELKKTEKKISEESIKTLLQIANSLIPMLADDPKSWKKIESLWKEICQRITQPLSDRTRAEVQEIGLYVQAALRKKNIYSSRITYEENKEAFDHMLPFFKLGMDRATAAKTFSYDKEVVSAAYDYFLRHKIIEPAKRGRKKKR